MHERPAPSRGIPIGVGLLAAAVAVEAALLWAMVRVWAGPTAAVLFVAAVAGLVAIAAIAYWLWGLLTLRYIVSRDGVTLCWAASRTVIPVSDITHMLKGRPYAAPLRGWRWPGHEVGRTEIATDDGATRELLVLSTVGPEGQLVIVTPTIAYAISPASRAAFIDEFKMRLRLGPVQQLTHGTRHPVFDRLSLAGDPLALRLLAAAVVVNVLAFAWLIWQYPGLPAEVVLRHSFDAAAGVPLGDGLAGRTMAWQLPGIGLAVIALNGALAGIVHPRARLGAQLLAFGAVLLQITLLVTMRHLVP